MESLNFTVVNDSDEEVTYEIGNVPTMFHFKPFLFFSFLQLTNLAGRWSKDIVPYE